MLFGLAGILILGIAAQWLAWRAHLPSILLLLIFGIIAGPWLKIINPDQLFGELLFPLVSVSVAIILFEGGLNLRINELRQIGKTIRNLTTIGVLVTWILIAAAAHLVIGMEMAPALLLGAILVVSGPTVIIPLLRYVRPSGKVGSIIKWEGIVNDPIGAILAVLVYEAIVAGNMKEGTLEVVFGVFQAAFFGTLLGILGALIIVILLKRYLIPDFLQNPVSLMIVVLIYMASNAIQGESGLLAVTVMGIALVNQRFVSIRHIIEFKENLRVLLISSLFIILAAHLTVDQLALFDAVNWIFVGILILVIRPVAVWLSTFGTQRNWKEKIFLSWMAPRGIVAAAVASVFAIRLAEIGYPQSESIVPITFQVIIGTVALYGLTAPFVARRLKLATPNPQGVLIAGAQPWIRAIAQILGAEGFRVTLVDSNWSNITAARKEGLAAHYADILSENFMHDAELDGIGRILAMTPNDEVNSLTALHFVDIFGRSGVYQLSSVKKSSVQRRGIMPQHLRGRYLFDAAATYQNLSGRFHSGAVVKKTSLSEEFSFDEFRKMYGDTALPLFIITESGNLRICTTENRADPKPGQTLISVVDPAEEDRASG
jgi:NhaP-type Na+/H+ or K+/H+ antiporter